MLPKSSFISATLNTDATNSTKALPKSNTVGTVVTSSPTIQPPSSNQNTTYTTKIQTPQGILSVTTSTPLTSGTQVNISAQASGQNSTALTLSVVANQPPSAQTSASNQSQSTNNTTPFIGDSIKFSAQLVTRPSQQELPLNTPTKALITQQTLGTELKLTNPPAQAALVNTSPPANITKGAQPANIPTNTQPPNSPNASGNTTQPSLIQSTQSQLTTQSSLPSQLPSKAAAGEPLPIKTVSTSKAPNSTSVPSSSIPSSGQSAAKQPDLAVNSSLTSHSTPPSTASSTDINKQGLSQLINTYSASQLRSASSSAMPASQSQGDSKAPSTPQAPVNNYQANLSTGANISFESKGVFSLNTPVVIERTSQQNLMVSNPVPAPTNSAPVHNTEVLAEALKTTLPNQQTLATSLNQLSQLPESTLKAQPALQSILSLFGVSAHTPTSANIRQAVENSGFFSENTLAKGTPLPTENLKALLGQAQADPNLANSPSVAELLKRASNRILQQQLQSVLFSVKGDSDEKTTQPQEKQYVFDLPLLYNQTFRPVEMTIKHTPAEEQESTQTTLWQIRLNIDLEDQGVVNADIKLSADTQVSVSVWCEHPNTFEQAKTHIQQLEQTLNSVGLECNEVECYLGEAPEKQDFKPRVSLVDTQA